MGAADFHVVFKALGQLQLSPGEVAVLREFLAAITFVNVQAGIRARGALHLQSVNGWHSRFKTWLRRFNGVASRYLASYTGWRRVLDTAALTTPVQWLRAAVAPGTFGSGR